MKTTPVDRGMRGGFTLVEMLVVITIIGILAALAIPAVIVARTHAKNAAVAMDLNQLETACKMYKEKFGEYPPDFALVYWATNPGPVAQNVVLRHLAKAFPRYTPGITGGGAGTWAGFLHDLNATGAIDPNSLTPQTALAFWLGGVPDPANNYLPSGFAADPTNPFQTPAQCASRISPFFDFDSTRLRPVSATAAGNKPTMLAFPPGGICNWVYWPQGAIGYQSNTSFPGAIVYFRAENGLYAVTLTNGTPCAKSCPDAGDTNTPTPTVYPAFDTRTSNIVAPTHVVNWVNSQGVQIFSAGLDTTFGNITPPTSNPIDTGLQFPTGENYVQPYTYDDITNFSGGTLENAIP